MSGTNDSSRSLTRAGRRSLNERAIFRRLQEQDNVFKDAAASPHKLIAVTFDSELSEHGDLTRKIKVVMGVCELRGDPPEYRWRIPHPPNRPPFAIGVMTRPNPLPYRVEQLESSAAISCTTLIFDLSGCIEGATIEITIDYSLENSVNITKRGLFSTSHTFVWTYTFVSATRYFETKIQFPRGASLSVDSNLTSLHAVERTAEIDGRAVYSYTAWDPRQQQTISGCLTYRFWSPSVEPILSIGGGAIIAIPAAFAANLSVGVLTFAIAIVTTGGARWLINKIK